jgi:CBS domain-containing protein
MTDILRRAKRTVTSTDSKSSVLRASETMIRANVGALVVLDEGRLVGILSERDVVARVVVPGLDPRSTRVGDVMTRDVCTATAAMSPDDATELMQARHFRHLPIVDASGHVLGVLSMRHLLNQRVEELAATSERIVNYLAADGPGG